MAKLQHLQLTKKRLRRFCIGLGLALLGLIHGCSNSLIATGSFPTPLVQPLNASASAFYSEELRSHHYIEEHKDRRKWEIATGNIQVQFFDTLLPSLFKQWQQAAIDPLADPTTLQHQFGDKHLVIRPALNDFQYSLPRETRSKVFEVWLKYNMQVYKSDGELLADWIVTAYGKTPSAFLKSDEAAMNAAIQVAFRDLGANLSINFSEIPELKQWLELNDA